MAKKRSKKKTKMGAQWILIALSAILLYQGIQYLLPGKKSPTGPKVATKAMPPQKSQAAAAQPTPPPLKEPVKKWSFQTAGKFLPQGAYPDNYQSIPTQEYAGLLAYAKTIPGKSPGPQGLTNTRPGLRWLRLNGESYEPIDMDLKPLAQALGDQEFSKLTGLPQIASKPIDAGAVKIYPTKFFLSEGPQTVVSYLVVDAQGAHWAPRLQADGKEIPAIFLQGTTRTLTRKVETKNHKGKTYLIVDTGQLNEAKIYEGYQWKVDAYAWNGKAFAYDKEFSDQLTKEKKL